MQGKTGEKQTNESYNTIPEKIATLPLILLSPGLYTNGFCEGPLNSERWHVGLARLQIRRTDRREVVILVRHIDTRRCSRALQIFQIQVSKPIAILFRSLHYCLKATSCGRRAASHSLNSIKSLIWLSSNLPDTLKIWEHLILDI